MATYEIQEHGYTFARIEADTAEEALEIAAARFPRRSKDYNGYVGPVVWRAFTADESTAVASLEVEVA